jgi:hypothetical protein
MAVNRVTADIRTATLCHLPSNTKHASATKNHSSISFSFFIRDPLAWRGGGISWFAELLNKAIPVKAVEAYRVVRCRGPHIF